MSHDIIIPAELNSYSVGERLKFIRQTMFLTRSKFAAYCDVKEDTLKKWETNKRNVSRANLIKIIKALKNHGIDLNIDFFYKINSDFSKPNTEIAANITYDEKIFSLAYQRVKKNLDLNNVPHSINQILVHIQNEYQIILSELNNILIPNEEDS